MLASGCSQRGAAASPGPPAEAGSDATLAEVDAGDDAAVYAICATEIDASFGSIDTNLLTTIAGCINICHTPSGAPSSGNLDFLLDASAIYTELLGPDGSGAPATNEAGTAQVLRVVPFDPDASLLSIKLNLHTLTDPLYGSGMPQSDPGSVCPATVDAVREWIAQGAPFEPHD